MDERHWWFAAKLQETFHFGGYDNPTLLEDFLSESNVIDLINSFLAPGEPHKLFFYCDVSPNGYTSPSPGDPQALPISPRQLHVISQLSKDVVAQGCVCLYVLRREVSGEVDVTQMEKELFCGELRHSVLSSLASLLTEVYTPLLHSQRNWGECSEESVSNFLQNFDKFSNSLLETAVQAQIHQPLLRRPGYELRCDLAGQGQHIGGGSRGTALLGEVLMECEALVADWIGTIESILIETTDERLEDSHGRPLAELTKWQRRQTLLSSLVEQLKSKESKSVLGALVATKSRLLKKWKNIDIQITDAFNNSRDRVRYLEALSPNLETLTSTPSPHTLITTTLPSLMATMKQMEGLSRAYARSGYLGILFIKISNSLVQVCKDDLESYCTNKGKDRDYFWSLLGEAIEAEKVNSTKEHPLIARLNSYLALSTAYKDTLTQLKDTLLQQQHAPFGLSTNMGPTLTRNAMVRLSNSSTANTKKGSSKGQPLLISDSNSRTSVASSSTPGISLHNIDMIMSDYNSFSARVLKILDIIATLAQFRQLNIHGRLEGLPRISGLWSLDLDTGDEMSLSQDSGHSWGGVPQEGESGTEKKDSVSDITMATPDYLEQLVQQSVGQHGGGGMLHLPSLKEESIAGSSGIRSNSDFTEKQDGALNSKATQSMVSSSTATGSSGGSSLPVQNEHSDSPSDSIAVMIDANVRLIQTKLELACSRGVEDIFSSAGKNKTTFPKAYEEYADHVAQLEDDLCAYLKAVFADMGSSSRALDIISRFGAVSSRVSLKESLHRCMLVAFSKYSLELEDIQAAYEKNKGSPPLSRNAPQVSGAVSWARQLLRRIEERMKSFKEDGTVLQSKESVYVCKLYNRLATAILKYETLWLNQWKGSMDGGKVGLKATLLIQQDTGGGGLSTLVKVNCKERLLELMAESKALVRLGVTIPDSAKFLLTQEVRVKHFKQQLEQVLSDFYSVQNSIHPLIRPLLVPTIEGCMRSLLPGWTTLTWSSMNIDAFLFRVRTSIASLKTLVEKVASILSSRVYGCLGEISGSSLFDLTLATSKAWHPDEFSKMILSSVAERSNTLLENVLSIRSALLEIISLTASPSGSEDKTLNLIATALQSGTGSPMRHQAETSLTSSDSSKKAPTFYSNKTPYSHSGVFSTVHSTRNTSAATLGVLASSHPMNEILSKLGVTEEAVMGKFCELVFDTVSNMVLKSHKQLCSCLSLTKSQITESPKEDFDNITTTSKASKTKAVTFDLPDSPTKGNSAIELESELINSISQTILLPEPPKTTPPLQLEVEIHFLIPRICLKPSLEEIHSQLSQVSAAIVRVLHLVNWWVGQNAGKPLYEVFEANGTIQSFHESIRQAIEGVSPRIEECLQSLRLYDFLWQQDMHSTCKHLLTAQPKQQDCSSHIDNFMILEEKIEGLRPVFTVGPLQLSSRPVKNSLRALAVAWKIEFASFLHEQGKSSLQSVVTQREDMLTQLASPVETLDQLKSTLELLHTITDMQNVIDEMYLPVERLYALLREYNPHLPRNEVRQVDSLRDDWKALTDLAEQVQHKLLSEERLLFEREVDKQVKTFVVETIQFRNSFDTEGPLVPGLIPSEAVARLGSFLEGCEELKSRGDLLAAVQKLLDIPPTPYPELVQTGQDLSYLRALYGNYQHFIDFDKRFRQELWAEVDLDSAVEETDGFWHSYESLPPEQQEWDAARKLKTEISQYRQVLPLLKKLHSKEVRNRHWLQVMNVVNCTFQLEGSIFKMAHLLDAGLLHHVSAIHEIVHCAQSELDLEEKFYSIEEEWSEAILLFLPYKSHGHTLLDEEHTHSLVEQLEHAHTLLATMLMSKHITPLREEASQWAIRLANMNDILQQWMTVQELWQNLEAVFNTPSTAKEFPEEAVKFASIHKRWIKLMRGAHEVRSVLQCCMGGEIPKDKQLASIGSGLEDCKKSLSSYLFSKRQVFPRLYYVSDDTLLSILSNPTSVTSVQSHLGSLFGAAANIVCSTVTQKGEVPAIIGVESIEGERLELNQQVPLIVGVEQWVSQLLSSIQSTLQDKLISALRLQQDGSSFSLEDCAHSQVTQVTSIALFSQWTKECEHALLQCRYDRRALPNARGKFGNWSVGKLTNILMRNAWKVNDEHLTSVQRLKLEAVAMFSLWMRDVLDDLCHHKLRDVTDFEWQRYIRPYLVSSPVEGDRPPDCEECEGCEKCEVGTIVMRCLDQELCYGYEYTGCNALPVFTPRTDNYIIALTQALSSNLGSHLVGPTGSGKVQIVKGIGQLCGRFVFSLHCSSLTDKSAIARTFEGLAQDGSWVCLSDTHTLSSSSLSIVSQMMHTIRSALQAKRTSCMMRGGKEVSIHPQLAVFLTSSSHWSLQPSLSSHFRTFSFSHPDSTLFLKAKCSALGLRAPKALANKLVSLQNMVRDQFSSLSATLTTHALCHVLETAKRKLVASKTHTLTQQTTVRQTPEHTSSEIVHVVTSEQRIHSTTGRSPGHELARHRGKPLSQNASPTAGQTLPAGATKEHSLIAQILVVVAGPMFPDQELPVFTQMVKEVFAVGVDLLSIQSRPLAIDLIPPPLHTPPKTPTTSRKFGGPLDMSSIPDLLREMAVKAGFVPSVSWMGKVEQLFMMTQLKHAVVLAGRPATGKSSALHTVASTLSSVRRDDSGAVLNVKVVKIYPGVFEGLSDLYGYANDRGDWVDGVFTDAFRKAHKATQTVSWVCMDGELSPSWLQCLPELLGKSKTLTLGNGEHLFMNERNLKLVFETGCLENASPACLLNCGVVYFDSGVLGWRTVVEKWSSSRSLQEANTLKKYLQQVMDPVVEFVLVKAGQGSVYSEVGLLETCLAYLSSLLDMYSETAEVFSEVHVERLLLFSLIWSYGGVLSSEREQRRFSQLLKTLTNILPDDDSEFSVFDYYVDESGEWDVWQSRVLQESGAQVDMLGSVFVDTADTIRTEVLLELALSAGRHTLLVGPHGAGKTTICKHFLQSRDLVHGSSETLKQSVFNGHTGSGTIHEFMQVNFHHRQGYTYGPKHHKKLHWFIDDLHSPLTHPHSPTSHEYLRQLSDASGLHNLQKRNEWCAIEDLVIFACLTTSTDALLKPRLRRQLAVVHLPEISGGRLEAIISLQLATFLSSHTGSMDSVTLKNVVGVSTEVYSKVKQALKVSDMPGRSYYLFSLRQLESVYQGLCHCADGSGEPDRWGVFETNVCNETPSRRPFSKGACPIGELDHHKLQFSLCHELKRAFTEGLCRVEDVEWLTSFVEEQCKQLMSVEEDVPQMPLSLSGIPTEVKQDDQSTSSISPLYSLPEVVLHPVSDWSDLSISLAMFLRRYREEYGESFSLELSENNMRLIMNLHRALKFPRGNSLLVGALGLPLHSLATFALYIAGYCVQSIDTSKESSFKDGLRTLFRQAGLEGKPVAVILNEHDLSHLFVMEALNSLMASGELPTLFTNDEMDGLLQALGPSIKRDFPSEETDSMQYFIARIYRNLRVVLCLSPKSDLLGDKAHDFKGVIEGSKVIWMRDWTERFMSSMTSHCLSSHSVDKDTTESLRGSLYTCLSAIHCYVMKETGQLTHTGQQPGHLVQQTYQPKQQELSQLLGSATKQCISNILTNAFEKFDSPGSFECLIEKVLKFDRELGDVDDNTDFTLSYVGPTTYMQFLECFCDLFERKNSERTAEKINLSKALETICNTQQEVEVMKTTVKELRQKHEEASQSSANLLQELTIKSCQLERLKALLGQGSSVLSAMQMVGEQERLLAENEEDDEELLALFIDRRSSRYDALLQKSKDQLLLAESEEQAAKQRMMKSKERALHWQNKIDRNTIDQIKSLNNPPRLVGTIMELMFSLLRQYGEGDQQTPGEKSDQSSNSTPGHTSALGSSLTKKRSSAASHAGAAAETAKMEKEQWQTVQSAIGDSQRFLDLVDRLKWQDGLSTDAVSLIESKLATSSSGNAGSVSSESTRQRSSLSGEGASKDLITVAMARHAAESAANMCGFAISIVSYSNSLKPYKLAYERLQQAQRELEEVEASAQPELSGAVGPQTPHRVATDLEDVDEEGEMGEEGLTKLQGEVDALQEQFDRAVIEKHSLGQTCHQLADKLKTANHLLESLKTREESWQKKLDTLPTIEVVAANCILAAAFTTYCSPLKTNQRHRLFDALLDICKHYRLPSSTQREEHLLTPSSYPKFMIGEAALYHFVIEGLPPDLTSQQNGCIITYLNSRVWPLILDPLDMVGAWLTGREPGATLIKYKSSDLHNTLVKSMQDGTTLIISEVDCRDLVSDEVLCDVLRVKEIIRNAKGLQKVLVDNREIECNPNFKLFMLSSDSLSSLPPSLVSLTSVVMFQPERPGLKELLLDSFLCLQNPKTAHDRVQVRQEIYEQAVRLLTVENELLKLLAVQDSAQVEEPRVTKAILLQNKAYDDAQEGLTKALSYYSLMSEVHLSVLRTLASQASVIMDVVCAMATLLPVYETTFSAIQSVFLTFVELAGSRIQGEDSLIKMTRAAYSHFVRGYFEKDRLLFSLFLTLEIEISRGRGTQEEVAFLISPTPGRQFVIKGLYSQSSLAQDMGGVSVVNFGKKPFDWMTDSQWQMLLMLASHFSWVHDIIERQGRDGKEAVWRTVAEGVAPETINFTESLGYKLLPMHQLLIMYAMRPERISQCIVSFISTVLDSGLKQKRLNFDTPVELNRLAKSLGPEQIPLVLYRDEPDLLVVKLKKVALKADAHLTVCHLHGCGDEDYDSAIQAIEEASSKGHWLLLHHVHTCPSLISQLPSLLKKLPQRQNWKLWPSAFGDCSSIPMTLLRSSCKIVLESPLSIRGSVLHSLSSTGGELIASSSRQEWLPLLHNLALLHSTVRLRKHAYKFSWTEDYDWTQSHLMDTLEYISKEFKYSETTAPGLSGVKPISWSGIRHMIVEVFYGSVVTNSVDLSTFTALADHWIHPGGPRRESGRYHISSQFFIPNTKLAVLQQAVENASPSLVFTAEMCGFYYTPLIQLGWASYLFPVLALLSNHTAQQTKPTAQATTATAKSDMKRNLSITSVSVNSLAVTTTPSYTLGRTNQTVLVDKLPSFIQVPSQIADVSFTMIPRSALKLFAFSPALLKELSLQSTIEKLIENVPQPWKKDVLSERLKRHGEDSPFGLFMKSETSKMTECLAAITTSLRELQEVLTPSSKGDVLRESSHLVGIAFSLLTLTVPTYWLVLVGPTSPPSHWPLKEWVQDLVMRFAFLDRFLAGGLAKTPTYWLGAFFDPQAFLSVIQQSVVKSVCGKSGALEQLTFRADLTSRDKDHIRDPPPEGELFVYGVNLWGCGFEKTANLDLQDIPPKGQLPVSLPVLHLSLSTKSQNLPAEQQPVNALAVDTKGPRIYHSPCFVSNAAKSRGERGSSVLFTLTISSCDVSPLKWASRNLACTLRPF